jgi:hypothetical protein
MGINNCTRKYYAEIFGTMAGTSNGEIKDQVMLKALEQTPPKAYMIFRTDSQLCIYSLAK